ncbi:MAG: DUF4326 domain-containing protein [Planctomycetes bacterium]|nr:DUF4326 domain-containing protein [Planctomycetota bacterium]
MACYRVVHVNRHEGPSVYVGRKGRAGRGHPLANPFKLKPNATDCERVDCIAKYREWLLARSDLAEQLEVLRAETRNGERPLACWCAPKACHADVLAGLLAAKFSPSALE